MKKALTVLIVILLVFSACKSEPNVKRVDPDTQIDLSGYWNDVDVKIVCDSLIRDCLFSPRVDQSIISKGYRPAVIVGKFKNESSEHIDTEIISTTMEMTIFNTGKLDFVSGGDTRDDVRAERFDQQNFASQSSMAMLHNETGADYMLTGAVRSIIDREGNETVRRYYVNAELTDIETNQRLWMGQNNEIKKYIKRPNNRL